MRTALGVASHAVERERVGQLVVRQPRHRRAQPERVARDVLTLADHPLVVCHAGSVRVRRMGVYTEWSAVAESANTTAGMSRVQACPRSAGRDMGLARTDALVRVHRTEGVDPRVHPLQRELDGRLLVLEVADGCVDDLAALAAHQQPRRADICRSASVSRRRGWVGAAEGPPASGLDAA